MYNQIERLTDQAQHLTRAAAELLQTDNAFSPADMLSTDTERQAAVFDLLRMHGTASGLLLMLLDTLENLSAIAQAAADAGTRPRAACTQLTEKEREKIIDEIVQDFKRLRIITPDSSADGAEQPGGIPESGV